MKKIIHVMQNYLVIGLVFVIGFLIWNTISSQEEILSQGSMVTKIIFHGLAFNLMFWFLVFIIFLIMLVVVPSLREATLSRLANLKDRDEREEYITGKASRAVYISSLSLIILLLFYSLFSVTLYKQPKVGKNEQQISVGIGLHFGLVDQTPIQDKKPEGQKIFDSNDIQLSKSTMMLILLCWQLIVFNLVARKIERT